jgi:hypothetical protein
MADMIETPEMEWRLDTLHINRLSPTVESIPSAKLRSNAIDKVRYLKTSCAVSFKPNG